MKNQKTNTGQDATLRRWLALTIITTVCALTALRIEVTEPLRGMAVVVIGFYFSTQENYADENQFQSDAGCVGIYETKSKANTSDITCACAMV